MIGNIGKILDRIATDVAIAVNLSRLIRDILAFVKPHRAISTSLFVFVIFAISQPILILLESSIRAWLLVIPLTALMTLP